MQTSSDPTDYAASGAASDPAHPWQNLWAQANAPQAPGYAGVSIAKVQHPDVAKAAGGSVYDWIKQQYQQAGMGTLGQDVIDILGKAHSQDEATTMLRQTDAYKQRFAGNIARQAAGLPMLSEGDYLNMESQYRQTLRAAGLPKGFYDHPDDLAKFIGGDVSVAEIGQRAQTAMQLVNSRDPNELKAFQSYYGIDKGHLAAYFLDPSKAAPILQKQAETATIGSEALRAGITASEKFAAHLQEAGVTQGQARQAYGETAQDKATIAKLGAIDHTSVGVNDVVDAKLGLNAKAAKQLQDQGRREAARFSGRSGGVSGLQADSKLGGSY